MAKVSPAQFVRQVRQEISRISWATRRDTGLATITVFVMASIAAVFFLLVDMVLSNVVQFVLEQIEPRSIAPVSYTHLTLPTILLV